MLIGFFSGCLFVCFYGFICYNYCMFKSLIKLCLLCSSYVDPLEVPSGTEVSPDASGWVALGPALNKTVEPEAREEDDLSVWVIFAKQWGDENFMVRFPEDPTYRYISPDEMKISASTKNEIYSLRVLKAPPAEQLRQQISEVLMQTDILLEEVAKSDENTVDILYRKDGKWMSTRFFLTKHHLYILHSENAISHRENHQKFIDSLDVVFAKN